MPGVVAADLTVYGPSGTGVAADQAVPGGLGWEPVPVASNRTAFDPSRTDRVHDTDSVKRALRTTLSNAPSPFGENAESAFRLRTTGARAVLGDEVAAGHEAVDARVVDAFDLDERLPSAVVVVALVDDAEPRCRPERLGLGGRHVRRRQHRLAPRSPRARCPGRQGWSESTSVDAGPPVTSSVGDAALTRTASER